MQFESPSQARQSAALRLMQRVDAITKSARLEIFPMPGDPAPDRLSPRERQKLQEEDDALQALQRFGVKALRMRAHNTSLFMVFPGTRGDEISRATVQRLVDKGLLAWVNSIHSAAVMTTAAPVTAEELRDHRTLPRPPQHRASKDLPNKRRTPA